MYKVSLTHAHDLLVKYVNDMSELQGVVIGWTSLQKSCNIVVQSGRRLKHFPFPAVLAKRFLIEKRVTYTSQARNGVEFIINTKHTDYLLRL